KEACVAWMAPGWAYKRMAVDSQFHIDRLEIELAPSRLHRAVNERPVRHEVSNAIEQRRVRITSKPRVDDLDRRQRRDDGRDFGVIVSLIARRQIAVESDGN